MQSYSRRALYAVAGFPLKHLLTLGDCACSPYSFSARPYLGTATVFEPERDPLGGLQQSLIAVGRVTTAGLARYKSSMSSDQRFHLRRPCRRVWSYRFRKCFCCACARGRIAAPLPTCSRGSLQQDARCSARHFASMLFGATSVSRFRLYRTAAMLGTLVDRAYLKCRDMA